MDDSNKKIILSRFSLAVNKIDIPEGIPFIPPRHFEDYDNLTSIKLPDSIRKVGDYAFKGCSSLTMIFLLEGLLSIGVGCFSNCTSMIMVHIPDSVSDIKKEAFERCESLVAVHLSNQLESIEDCCFYQCKKLQRVIIPSSIKCIRKKAFYECSNLTEIRFHTNNVIIGKESFKGCALKKVKFDQSSTNPSDCKKNIGVSTFEKCLFLVEVNLSSYPVYTLKTSCFEHCESLRTVVLSKRTKKIMIKCFAYCISLKYIGYECEPEYTEDTDTRCGLDLEHVRYFDYAAFARCTSLESIKLYEHNIHEGSFHACNNVKRISLPGDMPQYRFDSLCGHFKIEKVEQLIVRSNNNNISYTVAYYAMYEIISRNPKLFEKYCTLDNLYPFEVAVRVLYLRPSSIKKQDDDRTIKVLYHYLREAPWILEEYLNKVSQ